MKRISALALLIVTSLYTSNVALSQERALKATIPFDFTVGDTWLPAGDYTISSPLAHVIELKNGQGTRAEVMSSRSYDESKGTSKLVFHKYGDRYFLNNILCPDSMGMNVALAHGKAEKRARTLEAANHPGGRQVLVATR